MTIRDGHMSPLGARDSGSAIRGCCWRRMRTECLLVGRAPCFPGTWTWPRDGGHDEWVVLILSFRFWRREAREREPLLVLRQLDADHSLLFPNVIGWAPVTYWSLLFVDMLTGHCHLWVRRVNTPGTRWTGVSLRYELRVSGQANGTQND